MAAAPREGGWVSGALHGEGKVTAANGTTYEGGIVDGKRHGKGKETRADGTTYRGDWAADKRHGKGKMTWANITMYEGDYDGDWVDDKKHGKGKMTYANGDTYEGGWANDKRNGKGKVTCTNGETYDGDFVGGKMDGNGTWKGAHGGTHEGAWVGGKKHGKGKVTWDDGETYDGDWAHGQRHGKGKVTFTDGETYDGDWVADDKHGEGKMTYANGDTYEGGWAHGKKHGAGKVTYADGDTFESGWVNGQNNGRGKYTLKRAVHSSTNASNTNAQRLGAGREAGASGGKEDDAPAAAHGKEDELLETDTVGSFEQCRALIPRLIGVGAIADSERSRAMYELCIRDGRAARGVAARWQGYQASKRGTEDLQKMLANKKRKAAGGIESSDEDDAPAAAGACGGPMEAGAEGRAPMEIDVKELGVGGIMPMPKLCRMRVGMRDMAALLRVYAKVGGVLYEEDEGADARHSCIVYVADTDACRVTGVRDKNANATLDLEALCIRPHEGAGAGSVWECRGPFHVWVAWDSATLFAMCVLPAVAIVRDHFADFAAPGGSYGVDGGRKFRQFDPTLHCNGEVSMFDVPRVLKALLEWCPVGDPDIMSVGCGNTAEMLVAMMMLFRAQDAVGIEEFPGRAAEARLVVADAAKHPACRAFGGSARVLERDVRREVPSPVGTAEYAVAYMNNINLTDGEYLRGVARQHAGCVVLVALEPFGIGGDRATRRCHACICGGCAPAGPDAPVRVVPTGALRACFRRCAPCQISAEKIFDGYKRAATDERYAVMPDTPSMDIAATIPAGAICRGAVVLIGNVDVDLPREDAQ